MSLKGWRPTHRLRRQTTPAVVDPVSLCHRSAEHQSLAGLQLHLWSRVSHQASLKSDLQFHQRGPRLLCLETLLSLQPQKLAHLPLTTKASPAKLRSHLLPPER